MLAGSSLLNSVSGQPTPRSIGAVDGPLGAAYANTFWWQPIGGSTITPLLGGSLSGNTTLSTAMTFGSATFARYRRALSTSSNAINQPAGFYQSYSRYSRSTTGGWESQFVFSTESQAAGHGVFVGFSTQITAIATADMTTLTNCVGVGYTAADAVGADWSIFNNDGSGAAVKTPITGMTRSSSTGYRMTISCPADANPSVTITIYNAVSGAIVLAPTVISSELPAINTAIAAGAQGYTGASTTGLIVGLASMYITTTY